MNPALMNLRRMQWLSAAQTAGETQLLGMPDCFVPVEEREGWPVGTRQPQGEAQQRLCSLVVTGPKTSKSKQYEQR